MFAGFGAGRTSHAHVLLLVVPFAIFGAMLAIIVRGLPQDIYFQIGLLVWVGLSAKNAILIVQFCTELRSQGKSATDAALEAARIRFRPILMTSWAFVAGVIPLAMATGAGAAARHSIGTGVIGGMLGATLLAPFFVPLFFVLFDRFADWCRVWRAKVLNLSTGATSEQPESS